MRRRRVYKNSWNRPRSQKLFLRTIHWNLPSLVKNYHGIIGLSRPSIRNKRNCRTSCTTSKRGNIRRIIAVWIGWKVVARIYGMLLLSAKCPRPPGRRENSVWTKIRGTIQRTNYSMRCTGGISPKLHAFIGREFGREIFWLLFLKNCKSWTHQKKIPEDWMQKKSG